MTTRRQFLATTGAAAAACWAEPCLAAAGATTGKRGCCFTYKDPAGWREKLDRLRPDWVYTWGSETPDNLPAGVEFTPMIWGKAPPERLAEKTDELRKRAEAGEFAHLLGFNEPDRDTQSDIPVERALELWPHLMEAGVPLVSPACVHPDREWMTEFMDEADRRDLRVDAVAMHTYAGPSVEHLVKRLRDVHARYGRPIWITEFAVGDWKAEDVSQNRHRPERIARFLREALPALDELRFVERYAWFSAAPSSPALGTSALLDERGELTPLGEVYATH